MVLTKGVMAPSHLLFADDIFIFANGRTKGLKFLIKWLKMYQEASGCLPQTYLGIPLIQGRLTKEILRPLVDKNKKKATGWAGSLLSIQGRAVLIKSVLSSISIYSMGIYKWPTSMIKEGERILRNFLWSGEPDTKKACVVAWDKDEWSEFVRAKFIVKSGNFSTCTKGSSIWAGVRGALKDVCSNSGWVIGDGSCIDLWRDIWSSPISLKDLINNDNIPWKNLHAKVSSIIVDGRWPLPHNLLLIFHRLGVDINNIKINTNKADRRVWKPDLVGKFFVKGSFDVIRAKGQTIWWSKYLYRKVFILKLLCGARNSIMGSCPLMITYNRKEFLLFPDAAFVLKRNLKSLLLAGDTMSPYLKDFWIGAIWGGTKLIWHARNKKIFEDHIITLDKEKRKWSKLFHDTAFLSKGRRVKSRSIWMGQLGIIPVKVELVAFLEIVRVTCLVLTKGLGMVTNYTAECQAIIHGVASTASNGWLIAWVESDSKATVEAFNSDNIPWNQEM
ncbi:hypothetical protein GIB67_016136 [Kingdonia uniflora]|uniref:RNase H type-1 domain-containing protein n=1 Tax=Kingdonia uniflora TaxID=39325 RepID=A0A7J7N9I3_9MAGN|nr:hypothetical protein GIB67_016136 [Kingdonia uniflora]